MNWPFRLFVHDACYEQISAFLAEARGSDQRALFTAFRKICADPYRAGSPLQGLPQPIAGRVYKIWVGGRRGYRMVYLVHPPASIVVGILFSVVRRSQFDYDDADFASPALAIANDLQQGRIDRFTQIQVPNE